MQSRSFSSTPRKPRTVWLAVGTGALLVVTALVASRIHRPSQGGTPVKSAGRAATAYSSNGYGGYIGLPSPSPTVGRDSTVPPTKSATPDPVRPLLALYGAGRYAEVEISSLPLLAAASHPNASPLVRKTAARVEHLTAFAAARQKNLTLARERFALARKAAAALPPKDKGGVGVATALVPGAPPVPTLEEDSAYQHAVCTSALGDKAGAEAEYKAFLHDFPESPLIQAAIKRIARLHGGNIPQDAEQAWKSAMATAQARERSRRRAASVCGPECLVELLHRRRGNTVTVAALAGEMKTSEEGTALADLCQVAQRHGFPKAQGLALTMEGLKLQHFPVIALVSAAASKAENADTAGAGIGSRVASSGGFGRHFVVVEGLTDTGAVCVWDPDGAGAVGKATQHTVKPSVWQHGWSGIVLALAYDDKGTKGANNATNKNRGISDTMDRVGTRVALRWQP